MVHLSSEQNHSGTPEGPQESLGRECRSGQVLVGVDDVIVGGVVEENEAEADGPAGNAWAGPAQSGIR